MTPEEKAREEGYLEGVAAAAKHIASLDHFDWGLRFNDARDRLVKIVLMARERDGVGKKPCPHCGIHTLGPMKGAIT